MNPAARSLKNLQVQFLANAARWVHYGMEVEATTVDLPNVVCLLRSVGYNLRKIESLNPDGMSPLRNGQKGTKVVVTCGHSGQSCVLELPEEPEQCKCLGKTDNSQDSFWEVTALNASTKNASLIETGSDTVPAISKDLSVLLKNIVILLTHMIQGTVTEAEESLSKSVSSLQSDSSKGATSSPMQDARRLSGFMRELVNPPIVVSSPSRGRDSPARYRSLDTLAKNPDEIIAPPRLLTPKSEKKPGTDFYKSSPVINIPEKREPVDNTASTIADSNYEKVIQLLNEAISMLKVNKGRDISPSTEEQMTSAKEVESSTSDASLPSLISLTSSSSSIKMKKPKFVRTKKTFVVSADTGKASTKTAPKTVTVKPRSEPNHRPPPSKAKTVEEKSKNLISKTKTINLYSHVKSTIPKASPSGKFKKV